MNSSPRYTPSSDMTVAKKRPVSLAATVLILSVAIVWGSILTCCAGVCIQASVGGQSKNAQLAKDAPPLERWNHTLIRHARRKDMSAFIGMFPESMRSSREGLARIELAYEVCALGVKQGGVTLDRRSTQGGELVEGAMPRREETFWHVATRREHDQQVAVQITLVHDAGWDEAVATSLDLVLVHEPEPGVYAQGWPRVAQALGEMSVSTSLQERLMIKAKELGTEARCVEYFSPSLEKYASDPRVKRAQVEQLKATTAQLCAHTAQVFSTPGLQVTALMGDALGSNQEDTVKHVEQWLQGATLGQPFTLTYEGPRGERVQVFSTYETTFLSWGITQRFVLDGVRTELPNAHGGSDSYSVYMRSLFALPRAR